MKNLLLKVLFIGAFLGFSFASAEIVQDVDDQIIMEVVNSPTKNIVDQQVGDIVIQYKWMKRKKIYKSFKGLVIQTGFELDKKDREYKYIIVHYKNYYSDEGKYFKYIKHPSKPDILIEMNGEFKGDPEDREHSFFNMTPGKSWTDTSQCHPTGGCGKKIKTAAL